jgi:hypothetical protein
MAQGVLEGIVTVITSPMGQLLFWGVMTTLTFLYTIAVAFDSNNQHDGHKWRPLAAGLMCVFWMINALMWFSSTIYLMLFTDLFFLVLSCYIYKVADRQWAVYLSWLYAMSFVLDIEYWYGLDQSSYAWLSNIIYAVQLFVVSGWRPFVKQKTFT